MSSLESFIRVTDHVVEFEAEFSEATAAGCSTQILEVHREEMKSIWANVKTSYEKCLMELNSPEEQKEGDADLETVRARYRTTYQTYVRCVAMIGELIQQQTQRTASNSPVTSSSSGFHLPPCDTDVFSGDYLAWPSFRDMFTAIYVNNTRLSPVEKLFHLNQKTRGEARDIVKKSPLTNEGFPIAWKNLQDRFENKRVLVNSQLRILFNLPSISTECSTSIKKLQRDINSCISALKLYDLDIVNWDSIFIFLCSTRLPDATLDLWEQSLSNKNVIPKWEELDLFLTSRYQTLETVSDIRFSSRQRPPAPKIPQNTISKNSPKKINSYHSNVSDPQCRLCSNEHHTIRKCPNFLKMNADERMSCIKKFGLCLNCFARAHAVKDCKSSFNCFTCKKRHNTLLHRAVEPHSPIIASTSNGSSPSSYPKNLGIQSSHATQIQSTESLAPNHSVQNCFAAGSKGVLLGTAVVSICHLGITYSARALIDSGSEGTFISERLFKLLKLSSRAIQAQISGLNNVISARTQKVCSFILSSPADPNYSIEATALVLPHLTGKLPTCTVDPSVFLNLPKINLADTNFFQSSHIDILIGGDLFPLILLDGIKRNICGSLVAQETIFGWILTGPVKNSTRSTSSSYVSFFNEISLEKQISSFWEVEHLPQKPHRTISDRFCEEYFVRTTKRGDDGRYIVSLPFKEEFPEKLKLGHSRSIASAQYLRNESRLSRTPELKAEYDNVVLEYSSLGHMKPVPIPKFDNFPSNYYLPHHAVLKPDSTTTKVRVVFNASSPSSNKVSLNDALHTGPILQSDLTILILKWRFFRYVFNADIEKMYRQILVNPDQTPFQRILFRDTLTGEIRDFELKTLTFGVNCAPYLAIRTLLQLADDVKQSLPLASHILRTCMYVDDALAGCHDIPTALCARDELISALHSAGFSLRKWTSNSKDILKDLPREHLLNSNFLMLDDCSNAKTLGVQWNAHADSFFFSTKPLLQKSTFTKREVLSQIAKLFDPAGWLAPCIVLAKIFMQQLWLTKIDWDENLPSTSLHPWLQFIESYPFLNRIQIPRWIDYTTDCSLEFHAFCDASEKAYAAVIYIRVIPKTGPISSNLLMSKTKVAPVKTISIPRLELCGAVLLAEMFDALIAQLEVKIFKSFFWTDSTIVLAWLQKPPCQWKTFVANRVSKITETVGATNWFHVDSQNNPADIASRGALPQDLIENDLWWHGPSWLKLSNDFWPQHSSISDQKTDLELRPIKSNFTHFQNFEDILERFSSFPRAVRVIAYILRFLDRTHPIRKNSFSYESTLITRNEVQSVKKRLFVISQKVSYPTEYRAISEKHPISKSSTLLSLNPFLDDDGVLRVCGRLVYSPALSYNERHPVILPYNCQLSRLLVSFTHEISLHGGNQLVLRLLRQEFWIPRVKNLIKGTIHKCKTCVIYKHRLQTQLMGVLPAERTVLTRPFTHTGLDFAGPFDIKNYTGRACLITKGYVCVFVCFSTKAIHLEATSTLTTAAFLAAFNRFVSRRGCPLDLYSDNGKTFVGALKELMREFVQASRTALGSNLIHQNVTWHFIPPGAPHMGGLWEAGVKSFKTHLRKIASSIRYTFEEFSTLLSKIEACLNSRPISPMSTDPADTAALTPGHFLIGTALLTPIEQNIREQPISIINRWQRLKALQQNLCTRWKNEYLKELHKRNKWKNPQVNLDVNAMVVIREENLPPNEWRLGRVTKVYPGKDNRVRVADILTARGTITRPIVKLVVLPSN